MGRRKSRPGKNDQVSRTGILGIFGLIKNRKKSSQSKFVAVSFNIKSESAK